MLRKRTFAISILAVIGLGGCASVTPTTETRPSYAIYDIKTTGSNSASKIADAVKRGLQSQTTEVKITLGIPPHPLPEQPGRFRLVNPLGDKMTALMAASQGSGSFQIPMCDNSILSAYAGDSAMAQWGERTTFFMCLLPYTGGYHLDVYTTFTMSSGGFSPEVLGATLARSIVGDSSQFIPRTINSVVQEIRNTGATVELIESYP